MNPRRAWFARGRKGCRSRKETSCSTSMPTAVAPLLVERMEQVFLKSPSVVAVTGPYRFYDWDWIGIAGARVYDYTLAPFAQFTAHHLLRMGALLSGGNFAVRRSALDAIGGFDTSIEFHGEDTNLGMRLAQVGAVRLNNGCFIYTSARRYKALGRGGVFGFRPQFLVGGRSPSTEGPHARGRQALTCRGTSRI